MWQQGALSQDGAEAQLTDYPGFMARQKCSQCVHSLFLKAEQAYAETQLPPLLVPTKNSQSMLNSRVIKFQERETCTFE